MISKFMQSHQCEIHDQNMISQSVGQIIHQIHADTSSFTFVIPISDSYDIYLFEKEIRLR